LDGTVKAPVNMAGQSNWIVFARITGLSVSGIGAFDAQGSLAWSQNQCSNREKGGQCKFPITIRFNSITDGTITGISSIDSKLFHINVLGGKNIKFESVKIIAPATSMNTDGIHISRSDGVHISNSIIATGDDCVSIGGGSSNVNVSGVTCGPGHGISVGSLGKNKNEEVVNGVTVKNCTFANTDNGVRVKTW
ncbi:glycosyl hydrolase family 28 protein, partial [Ralstonia pseudosolanacearum]|uniref:glycosyl hydrolase family 28 protein n=1 Tax=Ralstonia pseudosolanacearum TaxID=1310165 RepID=UPI003CF1C04C